jgi:hypothetical protein
MEISVEVSRDKRGPQPTIKPAHFIRHKKGAQGPIFMSGGERGIRTLDGGLTPYSLSRGAPSATRPSLQFGLNKIEGAL